MAKGKYFKYAHPIKRIFQVAMDKLPIWGRIKHYEFTTAGGAKVNFDEARLQDGFPTFKLSDMENSIWGVQELRELAAECLEMAKYLERIA